MIPKRINKYQSGFTLLEMTAVVVVISIIGIGIIMTFHTIMGAYRADIVRQDIRHYGNTVIREITEKIRSSEKVDFSSSLGFARIDIWDDASQSTPSHVIRANEEEGIIINNDPLLEGSLRFPAEGQLRDNDQFKVKLESFTTYQETDPPNRPNLSKVKRSIRYIDLVLSMDPEINPNIIVEKEEYRFNRNLFVPSSFISELNL